MLWQAGQVMRIYLIYKEKELKSRLTSNDNISSKTVAYHFIGITFNIKAFYELLICVFTCIEEQFMNKHFIC